MKRFKCLRLINLSHCFAKIIRTIIITYKASNSIIKNNNNKN